MSDLSYLLFGNAPQISGAQQSGREAPARSAAAQGGRGGRTRRLRWLLSGWLAEGRSTSPSVLLTDEK